MSPAAPPPKASEIKQVRELMITKQWDEERVKVVLLYPCNTEILKKKLRGALDVPEDEPVIVSRGRGLQGRRGHPRVRVRRAAGRG